MTELFHRDVLQHIANAGVLDMERLDPVLERSGKLSGRAAELFKKILSEAGIRLADAYRVQKFFGVKEPDLSWVKETQPALAADEKANENAKRDRNA
jgi:hypothetical protein